ncbi:hypothetical protein OXH62_16905 [Pseudomonas chlororaphis]|uniref:hypothetical protein n=1 Tax=Pseudomonas chlororaphis TaxID=587753 RepID=UPI0035D3DDEC
MDNSMGLKITLDDFKNLKAGTATGSLSVLIDGFNVPMQVRAGSVGENMFFEFESSRKTTVIMIGVNKECLGQVVEVPGFFLYFKGEDTGWTADKGSLIIREDETSLNYSIYFDATATQQSVRLSYGVAHIGFR